jgi:hypothetical protein
MLLSSLPNHTDVTFVLTVARNGLARDAIDYPKISSQNSVLIKHFTHIPATSRTAPRVTPNLAPSLSNRKFDGPMKISDTIE